MVRRAMSKKKPRTWSRSGRPSVRRPGTASPGCIATASRGGGQAIYDEMYDFANYAFNKAHAAYAGGGLPDRLFQVPLPRGVYGGPADQRAGLPTRSEYIAECRSWDRACCRRTSTPTAMRSSPALRIPTPSSSDRRKRSAACTFPDIRWMPGSSQLHFATHTIKALTGEDANVPDNRPCPHRIQPL